MIRFCRNRRRSAARAFLKAEGLAGVLVVALAPAGLAWASGETVRPAPAPSVEACAALDHHGVWMIEEHGDAREMPDAEIRAAALRLLDARRACFTGDVQAGLAAYMTTDLGRPRSRWFR